MIQPTNCATIESGQTGQIRLSAATRDVKIDVPALSKMPV